MKKFLSQLLVFSLLCLLSTQIISILIICSDFKLYYGYPGKEIYSAITQSIKRENVEKLILGDSVSRQFYPPGKISNEVVSLACNQAISICGQYILLNEYLKNNKTPKMVELQLTPSSLGNNLDQPYTYHYFLKPFYKNRYHKYMDKKTLDLIMDIPCSEISQIPSIKATKWAPDYNVKTEKNYIVSEVSLNYLEKIIKLCEENEIEFTLNPMPVSESNRLKIMPLPNLGENINRKTSYFINQYVNNIQFYPDTLFRDGIHLIDISSVK
jgi:hypothetical protein